MKPDTTDTPATGPAFGTTGDEFPEGATDWAADETSRRKFLGVMGASIALATGAGCNVRPAPQRKILPYVTQPDQLTPGVPLFFASAAVVGGYAEGVLVRSHEGRPIKVEGNPDHPSSLGGTSIHAQASILDVYDPDRSRGVTHRGIPASYDRAVEAARLALYTETGPGQSTPKPGVRLRILTETVTSPTLSGLLGKLLADFPDARWAQFDAAGHDNAREGIRKAFGRAVQAVYDFTKADVVLSLDADFLCSGPGSTRYSRDFATRRRVRSEDFFKHDHAHDHGDHDHHHEDLESKYVTADRMSRLYAVETMPTNTGATADHRLALKVSEVETFARLLAAELGVAGAPAAGAIPAEVAKTWMAWIKPLADDLKAKKGKSVVVAGEHLPAAVHALVHAINTTLGNVGKDLPVQLTAPVETRPDGKVIDLKTLTAELTAKQVDALLILSGNPGYSAPADVPFADAVKTAAFSLHLGPYPDETAVLCHWHVNEAHPFETWGDARGHDGTVALMQPLIAPLHQGVSAAELIAAVTAAPVREGLELVKAAWRGWYGGLPADQKAKVDKNGRPYEVAWQEWVRAGVVPGTAAAAEEKVALAGNWAEGSGDTRMPESPGAKPGTDYELNIRPDPAVLDGRYANNGWLQELPKPLTKIAWDNAAFVGPETAAKLGCKTTFPWTGGEHGRAKVNVVELELNGRKVVAPVWILPGHAEGAVTVHLGYGRTRAGRVGTTPDEPNADGKPTRGFNAYALRTSDNPWTASGLKVTKTDKSYFLACTQGRWVMVEKDPTSGKLLDRKPVRRGTLDEYKKVPAFAKIPPVAAGETDLINDNVPAPRPAPGHEHAHDHEGHDKRLIPLTMYPPNETLFPDLRPGQRRRWGMAIDLSACTGCSACVVACFSENNIPVVGKDQVTKGRGMHWISIDRYYGGTQDDANPDETSFQPRMCVQCEKAPCEVVCPVGATVHSSDGLNDMTYNRCVGTRYCSNNCPYKVRRFNFLTYQDWESDTRKLGRNPDVSVRSRGVMEKCTFCVQRIRGAEIVAERELARGVRKFPDVAKGEVLIRDGEVLTACQAACPSGAIVFGDINDPHATVSKWKNEPANYGLLAELNTMPRLTHLAAIKNPNPAMPKGA